MRRERAGLAVVALAALMILPGLAAAQAPSSIAGAVTDATGSLLPGVTVEASSPALIDKIRTVVTDDRGQYRIVDLRPGAYRVAFTLAGFSTVVREHVELSSGFTATINAEMTVGGVAETITVSGESPLVDVRNTRSQQIVTSEIVDSVPSSRGFATFLAVTPGIRQTSAAHDVGGTQQDNMQDGSLWGGRSGDFQVHVDGMNATTLLTSGRARGLMLNIAVAQETNINLGGASAEHELAGTIMNVIPKDGGNGFSGMAFVNGTNQSLQSSNLSDELRAQGLTQVNEVKKIWDVNGAFGGPVSRDKLWFFAAARHWGRERFMAGNYWNKTQGTPFYTPDLTRPATKDATNKDLTLRLTWQAAEKHKFSFTQINEDIKFLEGIENIPVSPEAASRFHFDVDYVSQLAWTSPISTRVLLEGAVQAVNNHFPVRYQPGVLRSHIGITELSTGYRYNAATSYGDNIVKHVATRLSMSYLTGAHAFKAGMQTTSGRNTSNRIVNEALTYQFLNQVPVGLTQHLSPRFAEDRLRMNMGVYVQDQWTMNRLTLNLGLRYDYFNAYVPAQHEAAGRFLPAFDFPQVDDVPNWKDLSPRFGAAYNLFGSGRTAVKASLGRYVVREALSVASSNNPLNTVVTTVNRTWTDTNQNYAPDCDLVSAAANGECGAFSANTFGQSRVITRSADEIIRGFGVRPYNWLFVGELQQELWRGMSLHAGYARRWYGNFSVVDNLAVGPADYDPFSIVAPVDPRLPGGGGYTIAGLYDVRPGKFGLFDNLIRPASDFGSQTDVSDFINLTMTARFRNGALLSGGLDTGRTASDRCFVVDSPQEMRFCHVVAQFAAQTQVKLLGVYPLPWNLQVSGNWQNVSVLPYTAGTTLPVTTGWSWAGYVATNAQIQPSLGRNLSAGAASTALVELVDPFSVLADRLNQIDVRLVKMLRFGRSRVELQFDIYNALNANTTLSLNTRYGSAWLRPIQILDGRIFKFGTHVTF